MTLKEFSFFLLATNFTSELLETPHRNNISIIKCLFIWINKLYNVLQTGEDFCWVSSYSHSNHVTTNVSFTWKVFLIMSKDGYGNPNTNIIMDVKLDGNSGFTN